MMATTSSTFPIRAVGGARAGGSVTISTSGGDIVRYTVLISGLSPGSLHTVHDHLGRCADIEQSQHLAVLAVAAASSEGVIDLNLTESAFLAGSGRILLVYATAAANSVTGCADL